MGAISLFFASNILFYTLVTPVDSHAVSFFAVSLLIACWLSLYLPVASNRPRLHELNKRFGKWVMFGFSGGLVALIRWQAGPFYVLLLVALIFKIISSGHWSKKVILGVIISIGMTAIIFLPQVYVWRVMFGKWLTIPQGQDFLLWFRPSILQVLFSKNGLFLWTPIVGTAFFGLFWLSRKYPLIAGVIGIAFFFQLYINSIVSDWWAGVSFSHRRFVVTLPFLAISLTALIETLNTSKLKRLCILMGCILFTTVNLSLICLFLKING